MRSPLNIHPRLRLPPRLFWLVLLLVLLALLTFVRPLSGGAGIG
jgi:hypothetical protein